MLAQIYADFTDHCGDIDVELNPTTGRLQGKYGTAKGHMIGIYGSWTF